MERTTTAKRLQQLMAERGLRQKDILEIVAPVARLCDTPISKSNLSLYVTGKVDPSNDRLFVLAKALNVSEAWLMGFDVPMARVESPNFKPDVVIRRGDEQIVTEIKDLDEEQRQLVKDYIALLKRSKR